MRDAIDRLNEAQREAVLHSEGPLLILAGAGSGKTRVLTMRIGWLLAEHQVRPWEILAVTFTNKAAGEMRERVTQMVGSDASELWVSTFHSACQRILRREIATLDGFTSDFVIYDDRDSQELIKRVMKELKVPEKLSPRSFSSAIDRAKNEALGPEDLRGRSDPDSDPRLPEVYARYQERLKKSNALDFGDLLLHTLRVLESRPEVLERYRHRWRHLMVDEYQDTNHVQYRLVKALGDHGPRNVCVVGDEDQSIYSFRGANIRNILDFERDFPGARVVRLERNYRSTAKILAAATAVVERNLERKGKTLWTDANEGAPISLLALGDEKEEAFEVTSVLQRELASGRKPRDLAVFYRTNAQSRALEETMMASRLPFVLIGGQRFYERKEVKDAVAWLKVLLNPSDEVALLRAIGEPPRGIGDKTLGVVEERSLRRGLSFWAALREVARDDATPKRSRTPLLAFVELVDGLRSQAPRLTLPRLIEELFDKTSLVRRHREEQTFEGEGRAQNLEELAASAADYAEMPPGEGLVAFLDRIALVADADKAQSEEDGGRITLMTIHAAKGLEFPVVLVVGLDEGTFPHSRSTSTQAALEEERRLMYVAITRAQQKLYLLRARRRPAMGGYGYEECQPSRFLRDIPKALIVGSVSSLTGPAPREPWSYDHYVEYEDDAPARGSNQNQGLRPPSPLRRTLVVPGRPGPIPPSVPPPSAGPGSAPLMVAPGTARQVAMTLPFSSARPPLPVSAPGSGGQGVVVGTRVRHASFGDGEVQALEGPADNVRATVFFPRAGVKRIFVRYAGWTVIGPSPS